MKIEDVKSWPVPDCLKSVRQFLGFVGYYRRFIPNFADVAAPMVALTGKDVPFVWDPVCSTAFYALRDSLIHAPILAFPTETGQYILDTDASNFGLGGVLSQIQDDVERVVAYCSRALRPSQRRYCTTKREMLAAVAMCVHSACIYVAQSSLFRQITHKSLVWLHHFKDMEGMMVTCSATVPVFNSTPAGQGPWSVEGPFVPLQAVHTTGAVRRWQRFLSVSINLSTLSPPVALKMLILCLCIRERTGSRC